MTERKSRLPRRPDEPSGRLAADPLARFTFELATHSPTKDVASVKAASDIRDANAEDPVGPARDRRDRERADVAR